MRDDQIIHALAHRGVAATSIELTVDSLIPEVTIIAHGVYWHPVAAGKCLTPIGGSRFGSQTLTTPTFRGHFTIEARAHVRGHVM